MSWLTHVRGIALVAVVTSALGLPYPLWTDASQIFKSVSSQDLWWALPLLAIVFILTALPLVFLFALYRNQAGFHVPQSLRRLALVAALICAGVTSLQVAEWIRSEGPYFDSIGMLNWAAGGVAIHDAQSDPRTLAFLSTLAGQLSSLAILLLLIALFRSSGTPDTEIPVGKLLRCVTRIAVVAGLSVLAFQIIRLAAVPYIYSSTRDYARSIGRTPPALEPLLMGVIRDLLFTFSLVAAPFIVSRSLPQEPQEPRDADSDV
jgi:hypothetical protein